jgi:hypothetical protein
LATILIVGGFAIHGLGPLAHFTISLEPASRALLPNFFHWDSVRYVQIAQHGYTHRYYSVYFPLYPILIRVLPFKATYAALAVSWTATYLLTVALTYYVRFCLGLRRWGGVVMLAVFAPASFFFFSGYPESLEALGITLVLIFVHKRRFMPAALVAGVATALAPICVFFAIPILVVLLRERRWAMAVATAVVSQLGIIAYAGWLWARFGAPLLFWSEEATPQWNRRITYPFHNVIWSLDNILQGRLIGPSAYNGNVVVADLVNDLVAIASVAALVGLFFYLWQRRATVELIPGVVFAVVAVAFNLCSATAGGVSPEALARHLLVVVPLYLVVAYWRRAELTMGLLAGSVVLATITQTLYFHGLWFT